ncbi:hypothetical protein EDC04DRAFT_2629955, partial [Pisolithus marmoratus]
IYPSSVIFDRTEFLSVLHYLISPFIFTATVRGSPTITVWELFLTLSLQVISYELMWLQRIL